jgi:catechol 2,3-dioxygenase-like lactoylglutathione lyase family enzyme
MGQEQESAAAEVERLTRLRDEAEKGSSQHRELNHKLMKARRRLLDMSGDRATDDVRRSCPLTRQSGRRMLARSTRRRVDMLGNAKVAPVLPVSDLDRSIEFYEGKLGLTQQDRSDEFPDNPSVRFRVGSTTLDIYKSVAAGQSRHTMAAFEVDDLRKAVNDLRQAGVTFEEYDMPNLKTEDGIATMGRESGAWFKDPDGNILGLIQTVRVGAAAS